jgi:uncharacterized membrane protein
MKNLTHTTIIRYLLNCMDNGIALDAPTVYEWAALMGYPVAHTKAHLIGQHVAAAGRKLNTAFGYDVIAEHWPQWSENALYRAF